MFLEVYPQVLGVSTINAVSDVPGNGGILQYQLPIEGRASLSGACHAALHTRR